MTHQEVMELLPWYVNATLSPAEKREVERHLANCADCQSELDSCRVLQLAVVESSDELAAPSAALFNKAMAQIEQFERDKKPAAPGRARRLSLTERLGEALLGWCGPMPSFGRAVVAAQFVLILALAGGLSYSLWKSSEFTTLSGKQENSTNGSRIALRFEESITEGQLRQLLGEINGKIVSGPSALGIYTVEVPIPPEKTAELETLLSNLRAKQQIVIYAEKAE